MPYAVALLLRVVIALLLRHTRLMWVTREGGVESVETTIDKHVEQSLALLAEHASYGAMKDG